MAIIEAEFDQSKSFLTLGFARRRSRGGQPPRRPTAVSTAQTEPPDGSFKITRRDVIIAGAIIGGGGIATAILKPWTWFTSPPEQETKPVPTPPPTRVPEVDLSEVDLYYPQLKAFQFKTGGEIRTSSTTRIYSFADRTLYPMAMGATFDFFEKLANTQKIIEYKIGDQSIPFSLDKRPKTQGVFFIIPEDAPPPSWGDPAFEKGLTTFIFEAGPVSLVRVPSSNDNLPPSRAFTTIETVFNKNFSVEACQSSVRILSVSPEAALLGQEITCNSYGAAFTIKQMQVTYNDYQAWAKDVQIRRDPQSPYYPLYVLSEKEYTEILIVGLVIR